jgi:hypothetical protein
MRPKPAGPRTQLHFRSSHAINHQGSSMSLENFVDSIESKQDDYEHQSLSSVTESFPGPEHGLGSSDAEDHIVDQDDNAKH